MKTKQIYILLFLQAAVCCAVLYTAANRSVTQPGYQGG